MIFKLTDQYYDSIRYASERIKHLSPNNTKPRCIFAPVTGLDLAWYNKGLNHPEDTIGQGLLNEADTQINAAVTLDVLELRWQRLS